MSQSKIELPPCGLYRTGRPLKENPQDIRKGILVMFHNHSNRGIPMLQLPKENVHNVWSFHQYGPGIEDDDDFIEALQPIREQGFYYLREELPTPDGAFPKHSLVQLGYNMDADPILFIAQRGQDQNTLFFAETGYRFEELDILEKLAPSLPLWHMGQEQSHEAEIEEAPDPNTGGQLLN